MKWNNKILLGEFVLAEGRGHWCNSEFLDYQFYIAFKWQFNSIKLNVFVIEWVQLSKGRGITRPECIGDGGVVRGLEVIVMLTYEAKVNEVYLCMGGLTTSRRASSAITGGAGGSQPSPLQAKMLQKWGGFKFLPFICL